jgi:hypothetical protein
MVQITHVDRSLRIAQTREEAQARLADAEGATPS